jgi:hypothetical protein
MSKKRAQQNRLYMKLRREYLEAHPRCESPWDCGFRATEIHHKRGRVGALLTDVTHWIALCAPCHHYATVNPAEAIACGVSESRLTRPA